MVSPGPASRFFLRLPCAGESPPELLPQLDKNPDGRPRGWASSLCTCTSLQSRLSQELLPVFALHSHWRGSGQVTTQLPGVWDPQDGPC